MVILCHVPVPARPEPISSVFISEGDEKPPVQKNSYNFRQKVIFLAEIVRRIILTITGKQLPTDRDFYGNKRLECAGDMLALLFEDAFKKLNDRISKLAEKSKQIAVQSLID